MKNYSIDELKYIINTHNDINELWRGFIEKNECSPELNELIDKTIDINSKLIIDAEYELNKRNGETIDFKYS